MHVCRLCLDQRVLDPALDLVALERELGGRRLDEEKRCRTGNRMMEADKLGSLAWPADGVTQRQAGRGRKEARQLIGANSDHWNPARLQHLEGRGQVEDRLCTRADHRDRRRRELVDVRGDIEALPRAAVDATDPTRREQLDACPMGNAQRRADRRRRQPTAGESQAQVTRCGLRWSRFRVGEPLEDLTRRSDEQRSGIDRRRGGHRALLSHRRLGGKRCLDVVGSWQALGDEARLQCHDRSARLERLAHFFRDAQ